MMTNHTFTNIEVRIFKIIKSLENREVIKVADLLARLNLNVPMDFRDTFFDQPMIKCYIFMKLKGIKFQTQLVKYLKEHEDEALKLGFYRSGNNKLLIPDQRTLSYFLRWRMKSKWKDLANSIVNKVRVISEKFGIVLDVEVLETEKKEGGTKRTLDNRKSRKIKELCRYAKRNIYPKIGFDLRHNTIYTRDKFLDTLVYVAITRDYTENGCRTCSMVSGSAPSADTLLYHIKKCESMEEVQAMFRKAFDVAYQIAIRSGMVSRRRKVDIAIDFTEICYYGNKNDDMVVSKKPERGTSHCYKFATVNVVEKGKRITLLALPVGKFARKEDIVRELLEYARKKVTIRRLYVDRYFFTINMLNLFYKMGITFLMPAIKNSAVKKMLEVSSPPMVIRDYVMGNEKRSTRFNLIIVEKDEKKYAFATNIDIEENDIVLIEKLADLYSKRWGIETSYRVKNSFRARTTSKNYIVRLFYFLFSVLLYNLWIIIDSLVSMEVYGKSDKYAVTAKLFGTVLYTIIRESG